MRPKQLNDSDNSVKKKKKYSASVFLPKTAIILAYINAGHCQSQLKNALCAKVDL